MLDIDAADGRASQDLLELLTNRSLEESTSEDVDIEKITVPMVIKVTESIKLKIFSRRNSFASSSSAIRRRRS